MLVIHQPAIRELHRRGYHGNNVRIGLVDTGVDGSHPALSGVLGESVRFGFDGEIVPERISFDYEGHGSHSAGILCGRGLGVAPEGTLLSAASMHDGNVVARILCGLDWMLERKLQVLCLPFGLAEINPVFETYLQALREQDVLIVAAAGNGGAGKIRTPGNSHWVLSVGAVNELGKVAPFSGSWNGPGLLCRKPDVLALGVNVVSAKPRGQTRLGSGTSVAACVVAGVAALLREAVPTASADTITSAIIDSATTLPDAQAYRCAGGILDPLAALRLLQSGYHVPDIQTRSLPEQRFAQTRLLNILERPNGYLEDAVLVLRTPSDLQTVRNRIQRDVVQMRLLERGRALVIRASKDFMKTIIECDEVAVATSVDIDPLQLWQFPD